MVIDETAVFAMDFAFLAVFISLAVSLWRGKKDVLPWLVAVVASILAEKFLPGKWYIAIGGISGAMSSVWVSGSKKKENNYDTD